jgi:SAM-dependent methyltransferase
MNPDEYRRMAAVQDHHWWFAAKRRIVHDLLERFGPRPAATTPDASRASAEWVLDLGCGTGSMLPVMRKWGKPVGLDAYLPALRMVAHRPLVGGNLLQLPFPAGRFRLIGCFDVLYHRQVADVTQALQEIRRVCDPGGFLIITDSAFPILRGSHDEAVHGGRRFRLKQLARLVEAAGFDVVRRSYFHSAIFPAAAAIRLGQRLRAGGRSADAGAEGAATDRRSDLHPAPEWVNRVLGTVSAGEAAVVRRARLPFGLSLILLARATSPPRS